MDRRRFLATVGTATALGLAGCAGDDGEGTTPAPTTNGPTTTDAAGSTTTAQPTTAQPTTTSAATTTASAPPVTLENGSFEAGLEGWQVGRDLPIDPNTGEPVATSFEVVRGATGGRPSASDGDRVLSLFIDGRQDDGTIWVQQQADLREVDAIAVDVYSEMDSANTVTKVAAYAGALPDTPLAESAFDTSRPADAHEGWQTFAYDASPEPQGLVAVGISVVWETEITTFLDNVRLE